MANAKEALDWVTQGGLHGLGESLYSPFSGPEGDDLDLEAYRWLVRYVVGDLNRPMLWTTSGVGEWWALTMEERKILLEVAVEESRAINPNTVIQANTQANGAKDALELTLHAQEAGADICFIQTPPLEAMGREGILRYFKYIADRTDIALGIFNTPSSGLILSGEDMAALHHEIPALVAVKEGVNDSISRTLVAKSLAPNLQIWECDPIGMQAGWARDGIVPKAIFGNIGYLMETPDKPIIQEYYALLFADKLEEASVYARESGMNEIGAQAGVWANNHPSRPDYMFHWGGGMKYMASVIGLPVGEYPHGRAPQVPIHDEAKLQIRSVLEKHGMAGAVNAPML